MSILEPNISTLSLNYTITSVLFSDEYEMPPPPPKKQKSVSSKDAEARAEKEVVKSSAPPKKLTSTPNVLELLQKGAMAKASTTTPSSSEGHVSTPYLGSPRADV